VLPAGALVVAVVLASPGPDGELPLRVSSASAASEQHGRVVLDERSTESLAPPVAFGRPGTCTWHGGASDRSVELLDLAHQRVAPRSRTSASR
jgi:hypothetical protein